MNILEQAHKIVYERSEEDDRNYGDFMVSMQKMASLASIMTGHKLTRRDCYLIMVALKLSREAHAHKRDNILDAVAYLAQMQKEEDDRAG